MKSDIKGRLVLLITELKQELDFKHCSVWVTIENLILSSSGSYIFNAGKKDYPARIEIPTTNADKYRVDPLNLLNIGSNLGYHLGWISLPQFKCFSRWNAKKWSANPRIRDYSLSFGRIPWGNRKYYIYELTGDELAQLFKNYINTMDSYAIRNILTEILKYNKVI